MSFSRYLKDTDLSYVEGILQNEQESIIRDILAKESLSYIDFLYLLSPAAEPYLQAMAHKSIRLTRAHFGKTMQFYVPLYLSNECCNACVYCGFNVNKKIKRITSTPSEIEEGLEKLSRHGFQSVLLLTGEDYNKAGVEFVVDAIKRAREFFSYVALEIFPASVDGYKQFVKAGASGLTIYQETYHSTTYKKMHIAGPKMDYDWRLDTPDRAFQAGIRKVGIGALLGLHDWRYEAALLGLHAEYLMKKYWRGEVSISFPRIRDSQFGADVSDKNMVQMMLALRLFQPTVGLVLSTREPAQLRDKLIDIGITQISAESKTNPGGYTSSDADEQFAVSDNRTLDEMRDLVRNKGFDPVMKDWAYEFGK